MERAGEHGDGLTLFDRVFAADGGGVRQCHSVEAEHRRGQSQRFVDHLPQMIHELADVVVGRQVFVVHAAHRVDLGMDTRQDRGVLHQVVERIGHQLRGRQLAGDQEGHDLIADVLRVEYRFAAGVPPQHDVEQIVELAGGRTAAVLLDHLVEGAMQVSQLVVEFGCRRLLSELSEGRGEASIRRDAARPLRRT